MKTNFDGLSEYISRFGRMELINMLLKNLDSKNKVAVSLEVSKSTLSGWINEKDRHPCNNSLKKILKLAWKTDPKNTKKLLEEELDAFRGAINLFVRRGANQKKSERSY